MRNAVADSARTVVNEENAASETSLLKTARPAANANSLTASQASSKTGRSARTATKEALATSPSAKQGDSVEYKNSYRNKRNRVRLGSVFFFSILYSNTELSCAKKKDSSTTLQTEVTVDSGSI